MSRLELSAIQTKLKAAIQNHQLLVIKMKADSQNAALKKGLAELQEEIKRLSEEQKKIVVKVRESLIRSSPNLAQPPLPPAVTQPMAPVGQTRLVNFSASTGATILPMGMVALPIAHLQRPAMGVTVQTAGNGSIPQSSNISLIPAGIIGSGCNISLSPISSLGGAVSGIIHGHFAIGNLDLTHSNSAGVSSTSNGLGLNSTGPVVSNSSSGLILNSTGSVASSSSNSLVLNSTGPVVSNSSSGLVLNSTGSVVASSGYGLGLNSTATGPVVSNSNSGLGLNSSGVSSSCIINPAINNSNFSTTNRAALTSVANLIMGTNSGQNSLLTHNNLVSSHCPNNLTLAPVLPASSSSLPALTTTSSAVSSQPLVQPQLLHQQQQQILRMIQQPHQRLASHTPIKVPQYTASLIRPATNVSTSTQFCNIAPAPSTVTVSSNSVKVVPSLVSSILPAAKPAVRHEASDDKEAKLVRPEPVRGHQVQLVHRKQPAKQNKVRQEIIQPEQNKVRPEITQPDQLVLSPSASLELQKINFLKALDLYTIDVIKEVMKRRLERKRRTTANPNYSFGSDFSRRDRNASVWTSFSPKKAKTQSQVRRAMGSPGKTWPDSVRGQHGSPTGKTHRPKDNHDDYCAACGREGQLLMCGTCPLVYHLDCLNPPLTEAPRCAWSCPRCLISGKSLIYLNDEVNWKSCLAAKTVMEKEKKLLQNAGREISTEKKFLDTRLKELEKKLKEQLAVQTRLAEDEGMMQGELIHLSDFLRVMKESQEQEQELAQAARV